MKLNNLYFLGFLTLVFSSCNNGRIEIPFTYERNVYLLTRINDSITGNIMFDTGAYGLYLDSLFDSMPGLQYGVSQFDRFGNARVPKFSCAEGKVEYFPEIFQRIDAKSSFGRQCDGIVGWDLFKDYAVDIDYQKKIIGLVKAENLKVDEQYSKIPLVFRNNRYYLNLEVSVTDKVNIKGEFVLDLGYGGSVYLTASTIKKYKLDSLTEKKVEFGTDWGLFEKRKSVGFVLRGKKIVVQDFVLQDPTIECSMDHTGFLSDGDYVGLFGNRCLEHFDVVIDFVNRNLYLKPNSNYNKKMLFKSVGVGFVDRTDICEGFIVKTIYLKSDADRAGVSSGDLITHIDGILVKTNSDKKIIDFYNQVGKERLITFKRNDSIYKLNLTVKEQL